MPADERDDYDTTFVFSIIGVIGFAGFIVALISCMWCHNKWKKLTQRHCRLSGPEHETSAPTVSNSTEFTNFPPPPGSPSAFAPGFSTDEVVFEPLPEIRSRSLIPVSENLRPARFTGSYRKVSLQDWFDELQVNFPRNQLKYLREVGTSWYGQAVEGEAYNITPSQEKTKVVVKILRVDASATEHMQYLQEARPFRDLQHPNLLHLFGRCLEVHPFLLIMEHCDMDLKTCLIEQRKSSETFLKNGLLLRMACNIAAGIQHMHEHGFIHTDVATHSCLVTSDFTVKVGDYGNAVHLYRGDFYCLGDVAFPLRWCAPESLLCTESIIEAKDITREANIWSFGILLWELLEFGKLPYFVVTNEDVIQKVLIDCSLKLEQPKTPCVHNDMIFKIMQLCWLPAGLRPTIQKVMTLLNYLYDNRDVLSESSAFESRWNSLQPALREHNLQQNAPANLALRFESDFIPKKEKDVSRDCDSVMSSDFDRSLYGDKSPSGGSFSIGYEGELGADISPSLLNLRGSVEDLIASDNTTPTSGQDDSASNSGPQSLEQIVNNNAVDFDITQLHISEAIRDLDDILAEEQTSSETSTCTTPEKNPCEDTSVMNVSIGDKNTTNYAKVNGNENKDEEVSLSCNADSNKSIAVAMDGAVYEPLDKILNNLNHKTSTSEATNNSVHVTLFDKEEA